MLVFTCGLVESWAWCAVSGRQSPPFGFMRRLGDGVAMRLVALEDCAADLWSNKLRCCAAQGTIMTWDKTKGLGGPEGGQRG